MMKALVSLAAAALAAAPLAGQPTAVSGPVQGTGYALGADDVIDVLVYGRPDMTVKTRIRADGGVTLPLLGRVEAGGRSTQQLADEIARRLADGNFLKNPIVNVEISAFGSRVATVLGEVGQSGLYPLERPMTVSMLLARAGGLRQGGADYVTLRRGPAGEPQRIYMSQLARGGAGDPEVRPGDTVMVPPADLFYVYGQVNTPGAFPLLEGMSVRQALARAGGPTLAGSEKKITVHRRGEKGTDADLDAPVRQGDVFLIRERLF